ncbi:MAG: o-succinylbenzoate synthase [Actinomycetes bacterium]
MNFPSLAELSDSLRVVAIPLKQKFRGITTREVALFEGPFGWGEFSPFLEYDVAESSRWLAAGIESAFVGWPAPKREVIEINATIPDGTPEEAVAALSFFQGCRTAKIKVAGTHSSLDTARLVAVERVLGDSGKIRIDANGCWSVAEALKQITSFYEVLGNTLEYVEQPCATVSEIAQVHEKLSVPVPLAIDEGIRKEGYTRDLSDIADVAILKVAPMGGVKNALHIAQQLDMPIVVSSALETSIGMRAGLALAAAVPNLLGACGLGTVDLLGGDVISHSLVAEDGAIGLREVVPSLELLDRWAAPDRAQWWQNRLTMTYEFLDRR